MGEKLERISKVYLSLLISIENNVLYIEQASKLSNFDDETIGNILTHCNGDEVRRLNRDNPNRTSLVFCGNCSKKYLLEENEGTYKFPEEFDMDFFSTLPNEIKEEQGLGRMIILPSFLLESVKTEWIEEIDDDEMERIKKYLNESRRKFTKYKLEKNLGIRDYKAICKIITTLNFFLNSDDPSLSEDSWIFKGYKAIAISLVELKKGKYTPFYYKNEDGRKLALFLILNRLPQNSIIKEAHFLKHRALIKIEGEEIWYKVALDAIGKAENYIEYEFFKKNNSEHIGKIIEINSNNIVLKQEYIPLCSNYLAIKDFSFLNNEKESSIEILKKEFQMEIAKKNKEIEELNEKVNTIIWALNSLDNRFRKNFYLPIPVIQEKLPILQEITEELYVKLTNIIPNIKKFQLKYSYLGIKENKIFLVNFANLLKR